MIRQFMFVLILLVTLALTIACWLIPEPYITNNEINSESTSETLSNKTASLKNSVDSKLFAIRPQQFIVVEDQPVKKNHIEKFEAKTLQDSPPLPRVNTNPINPPNFQYIGQMIDETGVKKVFLSNDDETHVLKIGDTVNEHWRVDSIENSQITLFDLTTKQFFILYI